MSVEYWSKPVFFVFVQGSKTVGGDSRTNHVSISGRTNKMTKSNYLSFWEYLVLALYICWGLFFVCYFMPLRRRVGGHINLPSVRPFGYRYMVCPSISSYRFGATALIFCRIFIHIMEVCMPTGFWFASNILKMTVSWI
jgi:hypothetical protein